MQFNFKQSIAALVACAVLLMFSPAKAVSFASAEPLGGDSINAEEYFSNLIDSYVVASNLYLETKVDLLINSNLNIEDAANISSSNKKQVLFETFTLNFSTNTEYSHNTILSVASINDEYGGEYKFYLRVADGKYTTGYKIVKKGSDMPSSKTYEDIFDYIKQYMLLYNAQYIVSSFYSQSKGGRATEGGFFLTMRLQEEYKEYKDLFPRVDVYIDKKEKYISKLIAYKGNKPSYIMQIKSTANVSVPGNSGLIAPIKSDIYDLRGNSESIMFQPVGKPKVHVSISSPNIKVSKEDYSLFNLFALYE